MWLGGVGQGVAEGVVWDLFKVKTDGRSRKDGFFGLVKLDWSIVIFGHWLHVIECHITYPINVIGEIDANTSWELVVEFGATIRLWIPTECVDNFSGHHVNLKKLQSSRCSLKTPVFWGFQRANENAGAGALVGQATSGVHHSCSYGGLTMWIN